MPKDKYFGKRGPKTNVRPAGPHKDKTIKSRKKIKEELQEKEYLNEEYY